MRQVTRGGNLLQSPQARESFWVYFIGKNPLRILPTKTKTQGPIQLPSTNLGILLQRYLVQRLGRMVKRTRQVDIEKLRTDCIQQITVFLPLQIGLNPSRPRALRPRKDTGVKPTQLHQQRMYPDRITKQM